MSEVAGRMSIQEGAKYLRAPADRRCCMTWYVYDFSRDACAVALKVGGRRSMFMQLRQKHLSSPAP